MNRRADFMARGWTRFPAEPAVAAWARAAWPVAERILADPDQRAKWLRCGGTWFAGVNVFPNDAAGAVPQAGVPPLSAAAVDFVRDVLGLSPDWDRAQVSVCLPGYPQPWAGESDAAFRYRRDRDAAHVDGLRRVGPARRRFVGERHGFILGLPLTEAPEGASPLVVWEGSHEVMRAALTETLSGVPPERWAEVDVTDAYHAARRRCFDTLRRVEIAAAPGESYLLHRLALHGVAPWRAGEGVRAIAYFRPEAHAEGDGWLTSP